MKKSAIFFLVITLALGVCSCGEKKASEDFEFSIVWNVYGESSYDSASGMLIKTTNATHPEEYMAEYHLTDEEKAKIGSVFAELDIASYPEEYDPGNGMSKPSMTLILTYTSNGMTKTVSCKNISLDFESKNKKGQKFLDACKKITDILMKTDTWKSFPEYEFFYE